MSKLTADTITDEQIRELHTLTQTPNDLCVPYKPRQLVQIRELCDIAVGKFALSTDKAIRSARVKCAAILNARKGGNHV